MFGPDPDRSADGSTNGPLATPPLYPVDANTKAIVDAAFAKADVLGAQVLGKVAGPFNRARLANGDENRGGESTLGNLVAEVQRWATSTPEAGAAQIAFMNPGGLRADMAGIVRWLPRQPDLQAGSGGPALRQHPRQHEADGCPDQDGARAAVAA